MNVPYLGNEIAAEMPEGPSLSLLDVLQFLKVRKWIILGTAAAITLVTLITLYVVTPLYTSTSTVMLSQRQTRVTTVQDVLSAPPTDSAAIENEVQVLQSRALAEAVVNKLHLLKDPEFNTSLVQTMFSFLNPVKDALVGLKNKLTGKPPLTAAQIAQAKYDSTVDQFIKMVDIEAQGVSTTIEINISSQFPDKAKKLASTMADLYISNQLDIKFDATKKAEQWLSGRLDNLASQANKAEAAVAEYKAANNLTDLSTDKSGSVLDQQLSGLTTQLILTRVNSAEAEARLRKMKELRDSGRGADITQVVASPLITNLREQEATLAQQYAQLSSTLGPRHPKMVDIESQKRVLDAKINEEVARVAQTLENDVDVAHAREGELRRNLNQFEQSNTTQSAARVKLMELQSLADSNRTLYNTFLSRFKEMEDQESMQFADSRLVSYGEVPLQPSFPKRLLIMALAGPASLFAGLLLAFGIEQMNNGFRTSGQIERALGNAALSTVPELGHGGRDGRENGVNSISAANYVLKKPLSSYSEAVRGLQMGLTRAHDAKPAVLLVTSAVPDEGKTTMAISLARQAALNGQRVVLVDCDMRRPSISDTLAIGSRPYWLDNYLNGDCDVAQVLAKDPQSSLRVVPARSNIANAPMLLASERMGQLLSTLRANADLVIIDSAPMLPVNDTKNIVPLVDSVLFVVRWEKTPRDAVIHAYRSLQELGAQIGRVVLMRTDPQRYQYYNFGPGSYDYRSYHED